MTTPTLPIDGQTPWGDELNTGILQVNTTANNAESSINNHASNVPADPHGDRAYAQSLVSPITTGVNGPGGYVKLNGSGKLNAALVNSSDGGMFNTIFDAVTQYGVTFGTGSDQSTALQNALTACGNAGGGIVWLGGNGRVSLGNYVVIPSNVWLLLGEGVILSRIASGTTPAYLISNVQFGTSNTPSTNIKISGGTLDAVGNDSLSTACTPLFIIQSAKTMIEDIAFKNVFGNPAVEFNGCNNAKIFACQFSGTNHSGGSPSSAPAIRINTSEAATTPVGLSAGIYGNTACENVVIDACLVQDKTSNFGPYAGLVGTDLVGNGVAKHTAVFISNSTMTYNDNFPGQFTIFSGNQWNSFKVTGCLIPEYTNDTEFDGWMVANPVNGWNNSLVGPLLQWRWAQIGGGGGAGSPGIGTAVPVGNTIEIIGDLTTGIVTNGTEVAAIPSNIPVLTGQIIPVTFTATNVAAPNGARLFFDNTTNHIVCENMGSLSSQRLFFHTFISLAA